MKYATTIEEQIQLLKDRGLLIPDETKAKEVLLDIGYYRLGSYLFPFEKTYPSKYKRTHEYIDGTSFFDALDLYYFDCDLRRILMKYLNRIEINFRTYVTYYVSNLYKTKPCWFISFAVMKPQYVLNFDSAVYSTKAIQDNPVIKEHHRKHPEEKYAPAWKTIEQMTLGSVQILYENIKKKSVQQDIALHYGVSKLDIFYCYLENIRKIRNVCAHGNVLFDLNLPMRLMNGPAGTFNSKTNHNIIGIIGVIKYFIDQISHNRFESFCAEISSLLSNVTNPKVIQVLKSVSGFRFSEKEYND